MPIFVWSAILGNVSSTIKWYSLRRRERNHLSLERVQPYLAVITPLWDALRTGKQAVVTSDLSLLEVLVKPIQLGDKKLQDLFRTILYHTSGFSCLPITTPILVTAANLRATIGIKTPDAIHAATALISGCTLFVTNDPAFHRVPSLPVALVSDIAAAP
jgi:predicted nucleic acid-binding protein